jgi:hypothetical protein
LGEIGDLTKKRRKRQQEKAALRRISLSAGQLASISACQLVNNQRLL